MLKRSLITLSATATLLSGFAFADRPGTDWITIEEAVAKARDAGYVLLYSIDADGTNIWGGEGEKADGQVYEFQMDSKNGTIISETLED